MVRRTRWYLGLCLGVGLDALGLGDVADGVRRALEGHHGAHDVGVHFENLAGRDAVGARTQVRAQRVLVVAAAIVVVAQLVERDARALLVLRAQVVVELELERVERRGGLLVLLIDPRRVERDRVVCGGTHQRRVSKQRAQPQASRPDYTHWVRARCGAARGQRSASCWSYAA